MSSVIIFVAAVLLPELVGIISTPFTVSAIPQWYAFLEKPAFAPPNWVFAPVWVVLYALMGIASYLVLKKGLKKRIVRHALLTYGMQLSLNLLWSYFFFGLRSPLLALLDIIVLWFFIVLTIIQFHRISRPASYLLLPYLLWVSFAALLNFFIVVLN